MPRVRSTQKLPIVERRRRTSPRMRAMATVSPTAADTKFCTVRPAIWVSCDMVDSPRVVLPVRVGHEADGGVERQGSGHAREAALVQRQSALQPLQRVQHQDRDRREGEE